jgi:hypothetical protein
MAVVGRFLENGEQCQIWQRVEVTSGRCGIESVPVPSCRMNPVTPHFRAMTTLLRGKSLMFGKDATFQYNYVSHDS